MNLCYKTMYLSLFLFFISLPTIATEETDTVSLKKVSTEETDTVSFKKVSTKKADTVFQKSQNETEQVQTPSVSNFYWGIGTDFGLISGGLQGRAWFRDVVGIKISALADYKPKAAGARAQLLYKMPIKKQVAPYFAIGGGFHLKKVDTSFHGYPFSKWINIGLMSVGGGLEARLGKSRKHAVALECSYQKGRGFYTHTISTMGNSIPKKDTVYVELPSIHAALLYSYYPSKIKRVKDKDNDGLFDKVDQCPEKPEDLDGYLDSDGCPDLDNDNDGVVDSLDKCLNEAEDIDSVLDNDGCPDLDNDFDGVDDTSDLCPSEKEDVDGFEDGDGCPDADNDGDKLLDSYDECPDAPEDLDTFEDVDGCPDPDNDGDGFADAHDTCPNQAETKNGYLDTDGCPDTVFAISNKATVIKGLSFRGNGSELHQHSFKALDDIVKSLNIWNEMKVEISAHTDARADAKKSKILTQKRANSVKKYLVSQGINAGRIVAKGFGKSRPIAHNSSAAGRAKNRRIEIRKID